MPRKKIDDPGSYYRKRIASAIYKFTGNQRKLDHDIDPVVLHIEYKLKVYLNNIYNNVLRLKKSKRWMIDDVYDVLKDTPEHYGVRRFLLVKRFSRKAAGAADSTEEVDEKMGKPEEPSVENVTTFDQMQHELNVLNDDSRLFKRSERDRMILLQRADALTADMEADEYVQYHQHAQTKFINITEVFDRWMGWKKMGTDYYLAFSWLALNRIKRILDDGLYNRRRRARTLFSPDWISYERMHPLSYRDFTVSIEPNETIGKFVQQQFVDEFLEIDDMFRDPGSMRTYSARFPILDVLNKRRL